MRLCPQVPAPSQTSVVHTFPSSEHGVPAGATHSRRDSSQPEHSPDPGHGLTPDGKHTPDRQRSSAPSQYFPLSHEFPSFAATHAPCPSHRLHGSPPLHGELTGLNLHDNEEQHDPPSHSSPLAASMTPLPQDPAASTLRSRRVREPRSRIGPAPPSTPSTKMRLSRSPTMAAPTGGGPSDTRRTLST